MQCEDVHAECISENIMKLGPTELFQRIEIRRKRGRMREQRIRKKSEKVHAKGRRQKRQSRVKEEKPWEEFCGKLL